MKVVAAIILILLLIGIFTYKTLVRVICFSLILLIIHISIVYWFHKRIRKLEEKLGEKEA